ncbi:MAG: hypothetical protein NC300_04950 [Bacteroidales bacterium]|nr:hypothetical protein [Clostridium sp.]MCM1203470.1 hypothetical protein [Bacteroidales bacterium]
MKIKSSTVAMSGAQSYSHYQENTVVTTQMRKSQWNALQDAVKQEEGAEADISISEQSRKIWEKFKEEQEEAKKGAGSFPSEMQEAEKTRQPQNPIRLSEKDEQMIKILRRLLEMLRKSQKGGRLYSVKDMMAELKTEEVSSMDSHFGTTMKRAGLSQSMSLSKSFSVIDLRSSASTMGNAGSIGTGVSTAWVRHTETSSFIMEQESATFSATGIAKTADGREIQFGVDLQMSRGFVGTLFSEKDEEVILTDPLVINLDSQTASVSDQKFYFDLDADGKKEEISSLGSGSGFLAYDKNGDGVINDGSELFGTKSGDGFADLAKYDEDGNGWIDENDRIFDKLKVWIKDENGNDRLLNLKEADVGAIYLGSADTRFHLNDAGTNRTNAVIQKTGVFLKETGEVGTIQHVDLAV